MTSTTHADTYITLDNGAPLFCEESALIELLAADVLFANGRRYLCLDGTPKPETIVLFLSCNDLWSYATADAIEVAHGDIEPLYQAWRQGSYVGVMQWACVKVGLRPLAPLEEKWRREGLWTPALDVLPAPGDATTTPEAQ